MSSTVSIGPDGRFETRLVGGRHELLLRYQEDPGIKDLPPLAVGLEPPPDLEIAEPRTIDMVRGQDRDGLEVRLRSNR